MGCTGHWELGFLNSLVVVVVKAGVMLDETQKRQEEAWVRMHVFGQVWEGCCKGVAKETMMKVKGTVSRSDGGTNMIKFLREMKDLK